MIKLHQQLENTLKIRINSNSDIILGIKKLSEEGRFDKPKEVALFAIILDRLGKLEDEKSSDIELQGLEQAVEDTQAISNGSDGHGTGETIGDTVPVSATGNAGETEIHTTSPETEVPSEPEIQQPAETPAEEQPEATTTDTQVVDETTNEQATPITSTPISTPTEEVAPTAEPEVSISSFTPENIEDPTKLQSDPEPISTGNPQEPRG